MTTIYIYAPTSNEVVYTPTDFTDAMDYLLENEGTALAVNRGEDWFDFVGPRPKNPPPTL